MSERSHAPKLLVPLAIMCVSLPVCWVLLSCSLFLPTAEVLVALPEPPAHWKKAFPDLVFRFEFPDPESDGTTEAAASGQHSELRLPKGSCVPVIARPWAPAQGLHLPCAGAVYPLDLHEDELLLLSWRRGPAAQLLLDLRARGLDLEHLNVTRLCAEMDLRGGDDPWNLDLAAIAAGLVSGQMRVTDIRLQPLVDLRLPAGPGQWFLESPLRVPCGADAQGLISLPDVGPGLHRLFALAGGERLDLYVSAHEVLWVRRLAALGPDPPLFADHLHVDPALPRAIFLDPIREKGVW